MSELYELPNGWEWKNFKDSLYLTDYVANGSFASLKENVTYLDSKDYAILVRLKDYSNGWNNDYVYVDKHSYDFLSKSSLTENDIVMCNVGSVGLHFRVPNLGQPMTIGPNSILIRPIIDDLDNSFLFYYYSSNIFKDFLKSITAVTAQPKFNKTDFKTLSIPLPPFSEQQRIVSKLDKLFEKIDKSIALHQKNMDEADVFMGSVLNDVFGELEEKYEKYRLEDLTSLITKGTTPTTNGYKFQDSGINFLKIENIVNGEIDLSTIEMFISEEAHQSQKRSQLEINDVLFSIAGTIGDTAIVKKEHLPMNTNQAIALIRPIEKLNSEFLRRLLSSSISNETTNKQRGGAIKNVSLGDIKELELPLPPLQIQQKVVKYLDEISEKIEKVKSIQKEKMDSLKALKASILDKAFRGEL